MLKKLIIIIPAYNEEKSILKVLNSTPSLNGFNQEIIVIDDGSTDKTFEEAKKTNAIVISNKVNLGLGRTFKIGLQTALDRGADIIVNIDADGQYDSNHIPILVKILDREKLHLVLGNRFLDDRELGKNFIKRLGNKIISIFISKILLKQKEIYDIQSGFRVIDKKLAKFLINRLSGKYTYTQEMMIITLLNEFKVKQISTRFYKRTTGKSRLIRSSIIYLLKILVITLKTYLKTKIERYKANLLKS